MKKFLALALCLVMAVTTFTGCKNDDKKKEKNTDPVGIVIEMQDGRTIEAEVYPEIAPKTVENFLKLVDEDFYAGLIFHRVIPGFMIQGGGMDVDLNEKPAESIYGEFANNGFENNLLHERGVLSMARTNVPDSASSQFFIMHDKAEWLDGEYAAFGKVTKGMDVVDEIANIERDVNDCPLNPPVIKTIRRK